MNRRSRVIAAHEFRATLRRRAFIITTLVVPLLATVALLGFLVFQSVRTAPDVDVAVGLVDHSGLLDGADGIGAAPLESFADRDAGTRALLDDEIERLIEIPADYVQTGEVILIVERRGVPGFGEQATGIDRLLVEQLVAGHLPEGLADRVRDPVLPVVVEVDAQGRPIEEPFEAGRFLFFMVAAGIALMAALMSSGFFQEGLSEEKENRIMEVLLSSSTPRDLMVGKLVGLGGIGLAQFGFWVACGTALIAAIQIADPAGVPLTLAELTFPALPLVLGAFLLFVLGYAFLGSLMAALGAITTSHREAQQVVFLLILPYIAPFWVMQAILQDAGGTTARVLSFIPFTAPVTGMIRLGVDGISGWELALTLGTLAVAVALAFFFALRVFEISLLMYGKRPKAGEVVRAMVLPRAARTGARR